MYNCEVEQVKPIVTHIEVSRTNKKLKKKLFGIFPIYESDEWHEWLTLWEMKTFNYQPNGKKDKVIKIKIVLGVDKIKEKVYWKFGE